MPKTPRRTKPRLGQTLLEFIVERLLGPPVRRGQPGESWWCCPLHPDDNPSFHTLPIEGDEREYWRCFGCGRNGDVYQLMRDLRQLGHPECWGNWRPHHQAKVAAWEAEWRSLNASTREETTGPDVGRHADASLRDGDCVNSAAGPGVFPLVDTLRLQDPDPLTAGLSDADPQDVEAAYRDATQGQRDALVMAFVCARTAGVDLVALCRFAWHREMEWIRWLRDMDKMTGRNGHQHSRPDK